MNNLFRGLLAGYGAKKLGGGCFSTILVFVILWVLLGQCNATLPPRDLDVDPAASAQTAPPPAPAHDAAPLVPAG